MEPRAARSPNGIAPTYRVTWLLRRRTRDQDVTEDFADPITYESESVALTCVDRKARALIDARLADHADYASGSVLKS
ncbi:hypothetical protein EVC45_27880 [Paraburkholderia sp. UYCP14C]|nr:hypothetical protein EVC45_27880 [Paraburkholderia sp. UYCP14C]